MSANLYSHPGYLYQLTREAGGVHALMKAASGLKEKEQMLHVYLTPIALSSAVNPFNNCRLKSVMQEVDVVVFDTPPKQEKADSIKHFCELLKENYSKETLLRINDALTEGLKSREVDVTAVDQKTGNDSEKLAVAIAGKVLLLMAKNLGLKPGSSSSAGSTNELSAEELTPKQRIHRKAEETGKSIEYIDQGDPIEINKELLFDKGFLELLLCSFITDQELVQELMLKEKDEVDSWNTCTLKQPDYSKFENHPTVIDLKQKFYETNDSISGNFTLAKKIDIYLSSKKKTLLVLEENPQTLQQLTPLISFFGDNNVQVKGPIKEPTGCFWKIKEKEATVGYLLGSIHITPSYLFDLNSHIRKCFEKSTRLAVEIDITRPDREKTHSLKVRKQWEEKYSTLSTEQIDNIISILKKLFPEEHEKIDFSNNEEKSAFIFCGVFKLKSKIFTEMELFSGIDLQLTQQAKTCSKPIEDLETEEQYAQQETMQEMRAADSIKDFILKVLSLEEVQKFEGAAEVINVLIQQLSLYYSENLKPLFDAWEEGNLEKFDHSGKDSTGKKMVMTQRNMNIAMKIVTLVKDKEKIFCCIGAAHAVGEMSVQAFLKNFGFSTERVFI